MMDYRISQITISENRKIKVTEVMIKIENFLLKIEIIVWKIDWRFLTIM